MLNSETNEELGIRNEAQNCVVPNSEIYGFYRRELVRFRSTDLELGRGV
jgi:hypothetical protein